MTEKVFLPHPSSPARRGSTSPSAPSPQERAPTGKPAVLYSQTSSRPQGVARGYRRNRIASVDATELRVIGVIGTGTLINSFIVYSNFIITFALVNNTKEVE